MFLNGEISLNKEIENIENWLDNNLLPILYRIQKELSLAKQRKEKSLFFKKKKFEYEISSLQKKADNIEAFITDELLFMINIKKYFSVSQILKEKEYLQRCKNFLWVQDYLEYMKNLAKLGEEEILEFFSENYKPFNKCGISLINKNDKVESTPYDKETRQYLKKFINIELIKKSPYHSMEEILYLAMAQGYDYQKYYELAKTFFIQEEISLLSIPCESQKNTKDTLLKAKQGILKFLLRIRALTPDNESLQLENYLANALACITSDLISINSNSQTLK